MDATTTTPDLTRGAHVTAGTKTVHAVMGTTSGQAYPFCSASFARKTVTVTVAAVTCTVCAKRTGA